MSFNGLHVYFESTEPDHVTENEGYGNILPAGKIINLPSSTPRQGYACPMPGLEHSGDDARYEQVHWPFQGEIRHLDPRRRPRRLHIRSWCFGCHLLRHTASACRLPTEKSKRWAIHAGVLEKKGSKALLKIGSGTSHGGVRHRLGQHDRLEALPRFMQEAINMGYKITSQSLLR